MLSPDDVIKTRMMLEKYDLLELHVYNLVCQGLCCYQYYFFSFFNDLAVHF